MTNGFTITNAPPPPEPSQLAEVTALVTAVGTIVSAVVMPIAVVCALFIFRDALSEMIKNLNVVEGPGGMKVKTHDRLRPATEAVAEMTAEEIAAAAPPIPDSDAERADPNSEVAPSVQPEATEGEQNKEGKPNIEPTTSSLARTEAYKKLLKELRKIDGPTSWYLGASLGDLDDGTFNDLLRANPASAVLFAWNEVETKLRALAKARGLTLKLNRAPPRILISALKRADAMPVELAELLREMMEIRNEAAHGAGPISETTAIDFRRSANVASREIVRQIWRVSPSDTVWVRED